MKENGNKKKNSGAGFYIALCCCVAAVGIVGFYNSRNEEVPTEDTVAVPTNETLNLPVITLEPENNTDDTEMIAVETKAEKIIEEKSADESISELSGKIDEYVDVIESGENAEFYEGEIVESVSIKEAPEFMFPVKGEVCHKFTGDELYYDTTMGDYRTHNGIDIKADPDTDVVAAADGIIEIVYTDVLGKCVIINHNNGYRTKYANLDDIENLKEGMELKKGDFIAHVGNYEYGEKTTEPHIHFEIIRDDVFIDPEEYLK